MSRRKVVKKSSTLHPSDELFLNGVPTDLLGTIPSINSIEALWEMSKLPRAQTEKVKLAIIKQVKRLERRKKRLERHGDDSSMLSTDSTVSAVNNTNNTANGSGVAQHHKVSFQDAKEEHDTNGEMHGQEKSSSSLQDVQEKQEEPPVARPTRQDQRPGQANARRGTIYPHRVYTESWDFTDPEDHHDDMSSIDESDFNRLAPLPSKNLFKNAHRVQHQPHHKQVVHHSSNYQEHSMEEFRHNQQDLSNGVVIARKESSLEEISQNLYSLFLSNTMINASSRRSINSRNRGVVSLLQHAHTVKTAAQNKARRRARAWQIRQKKRERAGRNMFRALRRAFNSYLSQSFQRFKHGSDLIAAVETMNELAEKEREMQRRHFAFQSKNTAAMLYWHACVKMYRTRMHHAWIKWHNHVIAFDTIRVLIIKLTKIKLASAMTRWTLNTTIMKAGAKVGTLNEQKKNAAVGVICKMLIRNCRQKVSRAFSLLVNKTHESMLLRKLFLRCTKIKLQGAFAMLQANARHATHEQLNETTNHAKELKSQLSSHLDSLKQHAATQLFMLFYRQAHHKTRRAFYILMTQAETSNDLKYLVQSIVSRTARRKTNEAFNAWKAQMFALVLEQQAAEKATAEKKSKDSIRERAGIGLVRNYARIKRKLNIVEAFCHWKLYVRECVEKQHATKCRTFALKSFSFVCKRLYRSQLGNAWAQWCQALIYLKSKEKRGTEASAMLLGSIRISLLTRAFAKLVDWVHVTNIVSKGLRRLQYNSLALAMNQWRKFCNSHVQENHSETLQLAAVKVMGFGFKRVVLHHMRRRFTIWRHFIEFKQRQVESMAVVSHLLSKSDTFWSLRRGFESLKSWRVATGRLLLISRLSAKATIRVALATWRTFVLGERHWDTKRAASRTLIRNYKAICDTSIRRYFRKWKHIHDRWRELALAVGICSKVTTRNVEMKQLTKGFRRWVMHVFNQREETIHKSYTYDRVRTTLTLARKVLESVYLERVKEAFAKWHRKVMQPKKWVLSRLTRNLAHKNLSLAFACWINFMKSAVKKDFEMLLISKVCTSWGVRVNAVGALACRAALRTWALSVKEAKKNERALERTKDGQNSALTRVLHTLYYCHLRESLKIWRQFAFLAKSQEANNVSLKLLVRSRIKTITMEDLRWGWTGWIRAVQFDRTEALKTKMKDDEQEKRTKLLKTLMRHRLLAIYSTYMRAALNKWSKYSASKRLGEEDVKSKNVRLRRFIRSRIRSTQVEGLRHGFASLLRNSFEESRIAMLKAKEDMKKSDSQHAVVIIVRHRINAMISEHIRSAWKYWERFVDDSRRADVMNASIDNENQVKNNTIRIILRHRVKQMYLENVRDAFEDWRAEVLQLRAEAEQTARDMEKLKIIMRQRFRDMMGGHLRWAWEKLRENWTKLKMQENEKVQKEERLKDLVSRRFRALMNSNLHWGWTTWQQCVDGAKRQELVKKSLASEAASNNKFLIVVMRHRLRTVYATFIADAFNAWLNDTIEKRNEAKRREQVALEYYEKDAEKEQKIDKFIMKWYRTIELEVLRHGWKKFEFFALSKKSEALQKLSVALDKARYDEKLRSIIRRRITTVRGQSLRSAWKTWEHFVDDSKKAELKKARDDERLRLIVRSRIRAIVTNELRWSWIVWNRAVYELQKGALTKQREEDLKETRTKTLKIHVKHLFLSLYISNLRSAVSIWTKAIEAINSEERDKEGRRLEEEKKTFAITSCMRVRFNRIYENNVRLGFNLWARATADQRAQEIEEEGNSKRLRLIVRSRIKSIEMEGLLWAWAMLLKSMNQGEKEMGNNRAIKFFMRNKLKFMYNEFTRSAWVRWMKYVAEDKKNDETMKREEDKIRGVVKRRIRAWELRELRWGLVNWTKGVYEMKKEELLRAREEEEVKSNNRHLYVLVRHRINSLYFDYLRSAFIMWLNAAHALKDQELKSQLVEGEKKENEGRRRVTTKRLLARLFAKQQRTAFGNWLKYTDMVRLAMDEAMADTRKIKAVVRRRMLSLYNEAIRDSFLTWFRFSEKVGTAKLAIGMRQEIQTKAGKIMIVSINRF
ncbi:hypothetical protein TrST_g9704 [Triparma strigata]|uniref:Sfi1 spindle body domain-containing protein n=1 Tax=Triparma strigata TaxID=1606541 RepID=A0A9W6ZRZ7_9STRA|nr:hypothetical protein TrST_g9704 [Triparma strigata]